METNVLLATGSNSSSSSSSSSTISSSNSSSSDSIISSSSGNSNISGGGAEDERKSNVNVSSEVHRKVWNRDLLSLKAQPKTTPPLFIFGNPPLPFRAARCLGVVVGIVQSKENINKKNKKRKKREEEEEEEVEKEEDSLMYLLDDSTAVLKVRVSQGVAERRREKIVKGSLVDCLGYLTPTQSASNYLHCYAFDVKEPLFEVLRYLEIVDLYTHCYFAESFKNKKELHSEEMEVEEVEEEEEEEEEEEKETEVHKVQEAIRVAGSSMLDVEAETGLTREVVEAGIKSLQQDFLIYEKGGKFFPI